MKYFKTKISGTVRFISDDSTTRAGFSLTLQCRGNFKQINNRNDIFKLRRLTG